MSIQTNTPNLNSGNDTPIDVVGSNSNEIQVCLPQNLENETTTPAPTTAATSESIQSSNKRKRSVVWDHFDLVKTSDGTKSTHATCKYCKKKLCCDSKNGTSTLARHRCDKHPLTAEEKDKNQRLISSLFAAEKHSIGKWKFDQDMCRKALAKLIIIDELPFTLVSSQTFKDFCWTLQPQFNVVSCTTITRDCVSIYLEEKEKLKTVLYAASRVSITTDLWTSIQNMGYMCVTAHFIDSNWILHKKVINFCVLPSPHTGETIGRALEECILEWGISKLCTITTDNASNNDGAVRLLIRRFINKEDALLLGGKYFHMRCSAHILNLVVRDGLDEIKKSTLAIRNAISYVRGSPSRLQLFQKCVEMESIVSKKQICLDCPTRWNSTFIMLETAIRFEKAFDRMLEEDHTLSSRIIEGYQFPTSTDWNLARFLCKFLLSFYNMTNILSGSNYSTARLFFSQLYLLELRIVAWEKKNDSLFFNMLFKMREKYNKYWGGIDKLNPLLFVAVVLDPAYKLAYLEMCWEDLYRFEMKEKFVSLVKDVVNALIEQYKNYSNNGLSNEVNICDDGPSILLDDDLSDLVKMRFNRRRRIESEKYKSELDRYLEEPPEEENQGYDVLQWWKMNHLKYPIIGQLARDILAIPVTTVASESTFSTGGRVLDKYRSSMGSKTVEALICAQDWLRPTKGPNIDKILEKLQQVEDAILDGGRASEFVDKDSDSDA